MKLIKFLNRHVFISIILFFSLMVGVAWAVSEHIAARTKLAVMPADDDVLAIYDTNAGTGLGIEVSVFRGDNLNAIVNAETGVADPGITMYDSSAGAGTADIFGTSTGAYDIIMSFWVDVAGAPTEYLQIDGVSETVDVLKPLTAPSIDAGTKTAWIDTHTISPASPLILDNIYPNTCDLTLALWSSGATIALEIDLWAVGDCQGNVSKGKKLTLAFYQTGLTITVDPGGADFIIAPGQAIGDAGDATIMTTNDGVGESITWRSIKSANDYWFPVAYVKAGADVWSAP